MEVKDHPLKELSQELRGIYMDKKEKCATCECYECDCEECTCECHEETVAEKGNDWVCVSVYDGIKSYRPNTDLSRHK